MNREEFVNLGIKKDMHILEIGPSWFPMYPKREGYNVEIVDYVNENELRKIYSGHVGVENIEHVDYVCCSNYADCVGKTNHYDVIAASHVIEVVVDLIDTLNDFSKMIKNGGIIKLVIPDKRYEYDYFREVSSIRTIIDTHSREKKTNNSLGAMADYFVNKTLIDTQGVYFPNSALYYKDHYYHEYSENDFLTKWNEIIDAYNDSKYIHIQSWVFTPGAFELIIYQLNVLGLIDLTVDSIFMEKNSLEFYTVLKKKNEKLDIKKMDSLLIKRRNEECECFSDREIIERIRKDDKYILIYGAGKRADMVKKRVEILGLRLRGFVVSDGYRKQQKKDGFPIYEFSEVKKNRDNTFIFIGVSDRLKKEIENILTNNNFEFL